MLPCPPDGFGMPTAIWTEPNMRHDRLEVPQVLSRVTSNGDVERVERIDARPPLFFFFFFFFF